MTDRRSSRSDRVGVLVTLFVATLSTPVIAEESADRLLDRVPPDASLAIVVEDLGDHARALIASPLFKEWLQAEAIREWLESDEADRLRRAKSDVEAGLGAPIARVADGLLGRAFVLSLHLPDEAALDESRGLLQTVVTEPDLLRRFIGGANAAEVGSGALKRVESRTHGDVSYFVRDFVDDRPDEAYVLLDDGTFVWTNAEPLLHAVLDRSADASLPGFADDPAIDRARRALPERSIIRVLVDPDFLARLAEADPDAASIEDLPRPLAAYLGAIDAMGAALEWNEGPVLHVVEALDPRRLPAPVRSWASRPGGPTGLLPRIPPTALLAAAGHFDMPALYDLLMASVPVPERDRVEALTDVIRGLLLGRDLRSEILPSVGPGVVGWVNSPAADRPISRAPAVLVASIGDPIAAEAIDNALRTFLAFLCLDENRPLRLSSLGRDGARISALVSSSDPDTTRIAFAVSRGVIVVGTDVEAIGSVLTGLDSDSSPGKSPALAARDRLFPDVSSFVYLDIAALDGLVVERGDELIRLLNKGEADEEAREHLDLLLLILRPFSAGYVTSTLSADATLAHRRLGLIVAK